MMCVLAMILVRVLAWMGGVMFVRPGVWVGVAQLAVMMQVAFDEFVGGGCHRLQMLTTVSAKAWAAH